MSSRKLFELKLAGSGSSISGCNSGLLRSNLEVSRMKSGLETVRVPGASWLGQVQSCLCRALPGRAVLPRAVTLVSIAWSVFVHSGAQIQSPVLPSGDCHQKSTITYFWKFRGDFFGRGRRHWRACWGDAVALWFPSAALAQFLPDLLPQELARGMCQLLLLRIKI